MKQQKRKTKQEKVAETKTHVAYIQLFNGCPVPMLQLGALLSAGEKAALVGGDPRPAMVAFAKANDIPFNAI